MSLGRIPERDAQIRALQTRITELEAELAKARGVIDHYREVLDRLSRLGNEPYIGNSTGNVIALDALIKAHKT